MTISKYNKKQGHQVAMKVFKTSKHNHKHIVRKSQTCKEELCHTAHRHERSQGNAVKAT